MTLLSVIEEANSNYDHETWDLYVEYGLKLKDAVKQTKDPLDNNRVMAISRMYCFMIAKGYSAVRFGATPWSKNNLVKDASEKLVGHLYRSDNFNEVCLRELSEILGSVKVSFASKICHVLWSDKCPIYDSNAVRSLAAISKVLDDGLPKSIAGWRPKKDCWHDYISNVSKMKSTLGEITGRNLDFHELDIILWVLGGKDGEALLQKFIECLRSQAKSHIK